MDSHSDGLANIGQRTDSYTLSYAINGVALPA